MSGGEGVSGGGGRDGGEGGIGERRWERRGCGLLFSVREKGFFLYLGFTDDHPSVYHGIILIYRRTSVVNLFKLFIFLIIDEIMS